jgi:MFS family permease
MINKRLGLLPVAIYGIVFFLGVEAGAFQLILLRVASEFKLDAALMGVLVAGQFSAITVSPLLFGWIADKYNKKIVILIFMLVFAGGCFLSAISNSVTTFLISVFMIGMGYSVCECVGSSALSDAFPGQESRLLNIQQCAFSAGAVLSPQIFSRVMISTLFSWRIAFVVTGLGVLIFFPALLLSDCEAGGRRDFLFDAARKKKSLKELFKSKLLMALIVSMFVYMFMESGVVYFADSLYVWEHNNTILGSYAISGFWLAMAVSRLFFAVTKIKPRTQILFGFLSSSVLFVLLLLIKHPGFQLGIFVSLGAMMGSIWPMLVGISASSYRYNSGTAASIVISSGGLGGTFAPVVIGFVTEKSGLYSGFLLLALLSLAGFLIMILYPLFFLSSHSEK